ncbi:aldo/keto reductase [Haladaptatus halobius]|uniref:aldo/keto reductase n=1 Tax=Haladaptatus halobius TaxID=2884875 RepID=UPI001D0B5AF0|nr:aldo/keto reductase [Haladaptatus halobius]
MTHTPISSPGFGTYDLHGESGVTAVRTALDVGYRHVDTARMYENEAVVGEALARSDVPREEVFVATKVGHFTEPNLSPEYIRESVVESRENLGIETIDLLYVHWPYSYEAEAHLPTLNELVRDGWVRHLGVSNFTPPMLDETRALSDDPVFALQVEMHPLLQQEELVAYADEHDLTLVAYSPLAQGEVFNLPQLCDIAEKHDVSPAQVSLAWLSTKDVVPIPKASSEAHVRDNFAATDLELDDEDIARIDAIDREKRLEDEEFVDW